MKTRHQKPLAIIDPDVDGDIALITDYMAQELSAEEKAVVDKRLDEDAEFFAKVWPVMEMWMMPAASVPAITTAPKTVFHRRGVGFWVATTAGSLVAAGIALIAYLGLPTVYEKHPLSGNYSTGSAETRDIMLPDRSRVHMGPGASVLWDAWLSDGRITVFLQGNATIDVADRRHLSVWTPGGTATLQAGEFAVGFDPKTNIMNVKSRRGDAVVIDHTVNPRRQALKSGDSTNVTSGSTLRGRVDSPVPPAGGGRPDGSDDNDPGRDMGDDL